MEYQGYPTADELRDRQKSDPNMFNALLYGAIAGIVGGAIWFAIILVTDYQVGILAIGIGWLVGQAVVIGSGRKRGMKLQLLSVLLTLAAMVGAEYFIVREILVRLLTEEIGAAAAADIPLFLRLDLAIDFVVSVVSEDPITLLFWALALYAAFRIPMLEPVAAPAPAPETSTPS
jgi:hypothetical protein